MRRMRPSSVVPGAAVNPNRAQVSTTGPVRLAAWARALADQGLPAASYVGLQPLHERGLRGFDLVRAHRREGRS